MTYVDIRERNRLTRWLRRLFRPRRRVEPGGPGWSPPPPNAGVREPRRPYPTTGSGAAMVETEPTQH